MKTKSFWFTLLLMAVCAGSISSCSKDEDEENVKQSPIVGVWKQPYNNHHESVLTLNANGTFDFYVYGSALTGKGNYTYDEITRRLALFYTSGGWGDRTYIVTSLTDKYMILMDHNGDESNWRKDSNSSGSNSGSTNTNGTTQNSPTALEKSLFNTSWTLVKKESYSDGKLSSTYYNDGSYTAIKLSNQAETDTDLRCYKMYYQGSCVGIWYEDSSEGNNYLALGPIYLTAASDIGKWAKYQGSGFVTKHTSSELVLSTKGSSGIVYLDTNTNYSIYYYTASSYN